LKDKYAQKLPTQLSYPQSKTILDLSQSHQTTSYSAVKFSTLKY